MQTGRAVQLAAKHAERSDGAHAVSGFHLPLGCAAPHPRAPPPKVHFTTHARFACRAMGLLRRPGASKNAEAKLAAKNAAQASASSEMVATRSRVQEEQPNGAD